MQMASEQDPEKALKIVGDLLRPNQRVFIGVIDVVNEEIESDELVCDRVFVSARHIPVEQLGTTDDCGFSSFGDDIVTSRGTVFAKISARVRGTRQAMEKLMI